MSQILLLRRFSDRGIIVLNHVVSLCMTKKSKGWVLFLLVLCFHEQLALRGNWRFERQLLVEAPVARGNHRPVEAPVARGNHRPVSPLLAMEEAPVGDHTGDAAPAADHTDDDILAMEEAPALVIQRRHRMKTHRTEPADRRRGTCPGESSRR